MKTQSNCALLPLHPVNAHVPPAVGVAEMLFTSAGFEAQLIVTWSPVCVFCEAGVQEVTATGHPVSPCAHVLES